MFKQITLATLSLAVISASIFMAPQAESAASSAKVTHAFGTVQARSGSAWNSARNNTALYPGMTLRTGRNSRSEIRYTDGSVVRLGSRTVIRVRAAKDLRLLRGKTWIKKQHDKSQRMHIRTPIAVATVIGTELFVSHNEKNISHVTTLNGVVEVSNEQGETKKVGPGEWVEIEPNKPMEDPTKFDWNALKKQERFLMDLDFVPSSKELAELDEDWK
jgi:ferric-dicitrate binding protein FerR (iron transport regulator)